MKEYIIKEILDAGLYTQDGEKILDLTNTCIEKLTDIIIKKEKHCESNL